MQEAKDVQDKLRCDTAKMNLSYYLNRKDISDRADSLVNLYSVRGFGNRQLVNSRRRPLLNTLIHSFRNDKKEREKNSFVSKMCFLKSSKEVVVAYNRPDRGDINFIDATKPRVVEFYFKELSGGLGGVAPLQDGRNIIIADRKGKFTHIDVVTKNLSEIKDKNAKHTDVEGVIDISLSPSETRLACGSKDKLVFIFEIGEKYKVERSFSAHNDSVVSLQWHQYKSLLVSCSLDETVKLWDVRSQELVCWSKDHKDAVNKCMFAPDGHTYFSMSKDKYVYEYDLRMKGVLTSFLMEEQPKDMHVSEDLLVCGDTIGNIRWFTRNGELIDSRKGESGVLALTVDQTNNWMVVSRKDNHLFEMYEAGPYCV